MPSDRIMYEALWPGGNMTALLFDGQNRRGRRAIARKIIEGDREIEQVGFLSRTSRGRVRLTMMGGEFSANGVRAAAYLLARIRKQPRSSSRTGPKFLLQVSGLRTPVLAGVRGRRVTMWQKLRLPKISQLDKQRAVVHLSGISHFVVTASSRGLENIRVARTLVRQRSVRAAKAVGVMFVRRTGRSRATLDPYVTVRGTSTMVHETSCGSGTIAIAILEIATSARSSVRLQVRQPSGEVLTARVRRKGITLQIALEGPVEYCGQRSLSP